MYRWLKWLIVVGCFSTLCLSSALAAAEVTAELVAHKVADDQAGGEILVSADEAVPGDVVEYRVVYRNVGSSAVSGLQGTLPLPEEMAYLPGSAEPKEVMATVDGESYLPVPLMRQVRLANGQIEMRPVPPRDYRGLRWALGELSSGQETTVKARARIVSDR